MTLKTRWFPSYNPPRSAPTERSVDAACNDSNTSREPFKRKMATGVNRKTPNFGTVFLVSKSFAPFLALRLNARAPSNDSGLSPRSTGTHVRPSSLANSPQVENFRRLLLPASPSTGLEFPAKTPLCGDGNGTTARYTHLERRSKRRQLGWQWALQYRARKRHGPGPAGSSRSYS